MDPLLVFPTAPPELAQVLDLGGWTWKAVPDLDTARPSEAVTFMSGRCCS